jgi:oligopeptide/dipeptide ABC transporter ATP-binding protein
MVFQEPMTALNPVHTIGRQLAEVLLLHKKISKQDALRQSVDMLDKVGIPSPDIRLGEYPHQLSGGMRQRVVIAMALACEPKLLIADEPTTALDVTVQAQVLDLLRNLQDRFGMAILFVTHNLGVVADICDRVAVMYAGRIVEHADVFDLFERPRHPYTEGLLQAMPQLGERGKRLAAIPGTPPMPWEMPDGCRFHPRCPYAERACADQDVTLIDLDGARQSRCRRVHELTLAGAE